MEKITAGFLAFVAIAIIPSSMLMSGIGATSGSHQGYVTALETNSFIVTNQRAYVKTSKETTQEDHYCVKNPEVYADLQEAVNSGDKVNITFSHPMVEWVWNCSGESAIITAVNPISE